MYCPSCGAESTGLKYCKYCGINLAASVQMTEQIPARGLSTGVAWAIAFATAVIGLGGLGIVFGTATELAGRPDVDEGIPIVMMIFGSATVFGIVAFLLTLVFRTIGLSQKTERPDKRRKAVADNQGSMPQLAPPSQVSSVTEHTTRNFERIRSRGMQE